VSTGSENNFAKQYGISQTEALDLIEKGFLQGADASGEFLEKVKEYGTQFKQAGFSAEDFIKAATQEVKGGVFSDKFLSSVKEVGLRMREETKAAKEAVAPLGKEFSEKLFKEIDTGAISSTEAFKKVIEQAEKLGLSTSQIQTIIADLGGGDLEDLGGLKVFSENLDKMMKINLDATNEFNSSIKTTIALQEELATEQNETAKSLKPVQDAIGFLSLKFQAFFYMLFNETYKAIKPLIDIFLDFGETSNYVSRTMEQFEYWFKQAMIPVRILFELLKAGYTIISPIIELFYDLINTVDQFLGFSEGVAQFFEYFEQGVQFVQGVANYLAESLRWFLGLKKEAQETGTSKMFKDIEGVANKQIDEAKRVVESKKKSDDDAKKAQSIAMQEAQKQAQEQAERQKKLAEEQMKQAEEDAKRRKELAYELAKFEIDSRIKVFDRVLQTSKDLTANEKINFINAQSELQKELVNLEKQRNLSSAKLAEERVLIEKKADASISDIEFQRLNVTNEIRLKDLEDKKAKEDAKLQKEKDALNESVKGINEAEKEKKKKREDDAQKEIELRERINEAVKELQREALDFGIQLVNQNFDNKKDKLDEELYIFEEKQQERLDLIDQQLEAEAITAQEAEQAKALVEQQTEEKKKQIENKKAQVEEQQAKFNKAVQIGTTVVNTATAVVKALASAPFPANLAFAAAVGAIGAIQLGAIIAQPIPKAPKFNEGIEDMRDGTESLNLMGNKHGVDTVPTTNKKGKSAWLSFRERIIPERLNKMLGFKKTSNEDLVDGYLKYQKMNEKLGSKYDLANDLHIQNDVSRSQKELFNASKDAKFEIKQLQNNNSDIEKISKMLELSSDKQSLKEISENTRNTQKELRKLRYDLDMSRNHTL